MSTVFPKWTNKLPPLLLGKVFGGAAAAIGIVWYYFTPKFWEVGYMPSQPALTAVTMEEIYAGTDKQVPGIDYPGFSHQVHAGKLGMDCRYCHSNVEVAAEANIPSVSTCMGCHAEQHVNDQLYAQAERVQFIRDAWESDESIVWRRVHKLPDYVRNFPHHVHVNAGVSCLSCHGAIMEMPVVHQAEPLSMGWCLDCHREPEPSLVPREKVTDLYWTRQQFERTGGENTATEPVMSKEAEESHIVFAGSPGGEALLNKLAEKGLHRLPANCGACHY